MIYTLTISPAIDYVMHLDQLLAGGISRSSREECYFGGKGINVSVVLTNMGIPNRALGFVAGFTGKALEEGLRRQGVETDFITIEEGMTRINVKIKADQESEINGQGAVPEERHLKQMEEKLSLLGKGDTLILSGSIPRRLPEDTYDRFLEICSRNQVSAVVDTSGPILLSTLKYRPFLVKPNHKELTEILGEKISPEQGARNLQKLGARNVIVSLGQDGAMLLSEDGNVYSCGVPAGDAVNTVGSGDSMVAGFVAGYAGTGDWQHALDLGSAAGAATAFSPGLATAEAIRSCLKQIEG